ncbi:box C/D snoRNA protein 1 [Spea bombifrons]|uniref:box C/D snoRNA protein 1 n=1 Tax=Spea bombifrons TaxID=233779 RepID=UPI00234B6A20|nr:box C/D snoRNA protein 1 [Spea bombifrons]
MEESRVSDSVGFREDPEESQQTGCSKRKMSFHRCEICGGEEAKYRCPGCLKYSCSLPCVKKHKTDAGCSGVRDKTMFVPLNKFNEINLLSDYRFLEDAGRVSESAARDRLLPRQTSNKYLNFMKNRARKQGIDLKILPIGFTKRRANSTFFHKKEQRFYWHLKLQFPQSQAEYTEKRIPDNKKLEEILQKYIDPEASDAVIRQRLRVYTSSSSGVKVFMVLEQKGPGLDRFSELDLNKSLLENLRNKTVIEYPTLRVLLKDHVGDLHVLLKDHVGDLRDVARDFCKSTVYAQICRWEIFGFRDHLD